MGIINIIDYESKLLTIGMFIGIGLASIFWCLIIKNCYIEKQKDGGKS